MCQKKLRRLTLICWSNSWKFAQPCLLSVATVFWGHHFRTHAHKWRSRSEFIYLHPTYIGIKSCYIWTLIKSHAYFPSWNFIQKWNLMDALLMEVCKDDNDTILASALMFVYVSSWIFSHNKCLKYYVRNKTARVYRLSRNEFTWKANQIVDVDLI